MNSVFRGRRIPLIIPALLLMMASSIVGLYYLSLKHEWAAARLQEIDQRYARLAGLAESRTELDRAESAARTALAAEVYLSSQEVSQAANDAQKRLRETFATAGLQVVSSQVLAEKTDRSFDRIPMVVRLEGDLVALQGALAEIPRLSPRVILDGMTVQTIGQVRAEAPQRLAIQFSLSVLRARQ